MRGSPRQSDVVPFSLVRWQPSYRIIPSRFPPVSLFERVADPSDLEAVFAVEALSNPRLREEVGALAAVPEADRIAGRGAGYVMASFTHLSPTGGRFSTAGFGAYYAARTRDTAIAETVHHRGQFLAATRQAPIEIDMRVLHATVRAKLIDLRGESAEWAALFQPDDYSASQTFAAAQRERMANGVVYPSVRDAEGECVAIWRPRLVSNCRQAAHLTYVWDGTRITSVFEKSALRRLG